MNMTRTLPVVLVSFASIASAASDCGETCRQDLDRLKDKYAACSQELSLDRPACYKEARGVADTASACMRLCNEKGSAAVEKKREEGRPNKREP